MQSQSSDSQEIPSPGLEEFVEEFLTDRLTEIKILRASLMAQDFESIRIQAHKWKGFSSPYGFGQLEKIGCLLEKSAEQKLEKDCKAHLINALSYLDDKAEQLKAIRP